MKRLKLIVITLFLLACFFNLAKAQNSVVFSYDKGGNMVNRKIRVLFSARMANSNTIKDSADVTPVNFKIYPNPTNQYLTVEGNLPSGIKEAKILLSNMTGQILLTDAYSGQPKTINVASLKEGLYLLEIRYSEKRSDTYKIIIAN